MYDPELGRWHTTDPLEQYVSPYVYVGNNPISIYDPTGMWGEQSTFIASTFVNRKGTVLEHRDDGDPKIYIVDDPDEWRKKGSKKSDARWSGDYEYENVDYNQYEGRSILEAGVANVPGAWKNTLYDPRITSVHPEYDIVEFIYTGGGLLLIKYGGKWIIRKVSRRLLIRELAEMGVKHTADDIIRIGKNSAGKIIFLETGSAKGGLKHILLEHTDDFVKNGVSEDDIADLVHKAATQGKVVGSQRTRSIYEITYNGTKKRVAITISDNGYIVGANPVSIK